MELLIPTCKRKGKKQTKWTFSIWKRESQGKNLLKKIPHSKVHLHSGKSLLFVYYLFNYFLFMYTFIYLFIYQVISLFYFCAQASLLFYVGFSYE